MSYLGNKRKEKFRFERLQSELETLTEQMSDIVARSHLRASQIQITYLTAGAAEKRLELNNFLFQIYREEKREAIRQKKREAEAQAEKKMTEGKMTHELSSRYYSDPRNNSFLNRDLLNIRSNNPLSNRNHVRSSEIYNRLRQMQEQQATMTPYMTMGNLAGNGRDLSMQLLAQDQRLLAIGERLRGIEGLMRSHTTNPPYFRNGTDENPRFVFYPDTESLNDDDTATTNSGPPHLSAQMWDCPICTFMNSDGNFCAMCETPRLR